MLDFNPYHKWLGVPKDETSASHYQILGISADEEDRDVIAASAVRQSAYVRNFQKGASAQDASRILNEIEQAKLVLLDAGKRSAYDVMLASRLAGLATKNDQPPPAPSTAIARRLDPLVIKFAAFAAGVTALIVGGLLIYSFATNGYRFTRDGDSVVASSHTIRPPISRPELPPTIEGDEPEAIQEATLPAGPPSLAIAPFNEDVARDHQQTWADFLDLPVEVTNSVGMELRLIPPGRFQMGSDRADSLKDESPRHQVIITRAFYLGVTEVTQAQYMQLMVTNPSQSKGPNNPVEDINWDEARLFCTKLSASDGRRYRLPTEAEWEFACRAGTETTWYFGEDEQALANHGWLRGTETHPVGQLADNPFGLFDLYGNVCEYCLDWYDQSFYASSPEHDPIGTITRVDSSGHSQLLGRSRVLRGGACDVPSVRNSTYRFTRSQNQNVGFRVLCEIDSADLPPRDAFVSALYDTAGDVPTALKSIAREVRFDESGPVTLIEIRGPGFGNAALDHFRQLPLLTTLRCYDTQVDDEGLKYISEFADMRILGVNGSGVTDKGIRHLKQLTRLNWLTIGKTEITNVGLAHLSKLTNLRGLNLSQTAISDAGLEHLTPLVNLEYLQLADTGISDTGLASLVHFPNLRELDLSGTAITDKGLEQLSSANLRLVDLERTQVTESGVGGLRERLPNCAVKVSTP